MALNKGTALKVSKSYRTKRVLKKQRPPRRAREWFAGLTNKYGYWDARFKFQKTRDGKKKMQLWLPQSNGSMKKVVLEISSRYGMGNAIPVKAFYHKKKGILIVITRNEAAPVKVEGQRLVRVDFRAHMVKDPMEESKASAANRFLLAGYSYYPDHGIVIGGDFRWFPETVEPRLPVNLGHEVARSELDSEQTSGQTVPPSFIAGKAFGLAVNHLRDLDHAKQGVVKIFGHIDPSRRSMEFARKRGFRELKKEERELLKKISPSFLTSNGHFKLMVRDFRPQPAKNN